MIILHGLNGREFIINCELIKFVEATPDTVITLVDNEKFMVKESVDHVIFATKRYKQDLFRFNIS
jgi:flagellar protein FlbD